MNTPYHCGFFLTVWDKLFNTCYPEEKECFCAECARSVLGIVLKYRYSLANYGPNAIYAKYQVSKERVTTSICYKSTRFESFLGHLVLSIDGMESRICQRMISILKYRPIIYFNFSRHKTIILFAKLLYCLCQTKVQIESICIF